LTSDFPFSLPDYALNRITMTPEKFGYVGSFCRSTLQVMTDYDKAYAFDQLLVRLTMSVMSGRTVTEHPEVSFTYKVPATWRDHLKLALSAWRDRQNARWEGTGRDGKPDTPPPWMVLLWPFLVLFPRWLAKHPAAERTETAKATLDFRQSVLYPELDYVPAEFGRPVLYETLDCSYPQVTVAERPDTDRRFMNRHEIVSEICRDPESSRYSTPGSDVWATFNWLERHGVNVDQLVRRR
jgi:hypothetical protein